MTKRVEIVLLTLGLGLWFALNLVTAERSPAVWRDEAMFCDPAVRWLSGRGFTSTVWPQPPGMAAVLNGPLYAVLLVPWLRLWGIGPQAVRSLGYVLVAGVVVWLWLLARERGAIRSPALRLVGVAAFLCGHGVAWAYRSGRYDPLGMLLVTALVGSALSSQRATSAAARWAWLSASAGAGLLVPFGGLYLPPYLLLLGVVWMATAGRRVVRHLVAPAFGLGAGCLLLLGMHLRLGTWSQVVAFSREETGGPLLGRLSRLPAAELSDPSVAVLATFFAIGVMCLVLRRCREPAVAWSPMTGAWLGGLCAALGIPALMVLAGKFPVYYGWMAFVPALVCVLRLLADGLGESMSACVAPAAVSRAPDESSQIVPPEPVARAGRAGCCCSLVEPPRGAGPVPGTAEAVLAAPRLVRSGAWLALVLAAAIGWPLRLVVCGLEWRQRDYGPVEAFLLSELRADDVVLADEQAYYPAVRRCREAAFSDSFRFLKEDDLRRITALVGPADFAASAAARIDSAGLRQWVPVATYRSPSYSLPVRLGRTRWYDVTVWRRR